jgi:hypothetical protein
MLIGLGCSETQGPLDNTPKKEKETKGSVPAVGSYFIFQITHRDSTGIVKQVTMDTLRVTQNYIAWEGYDSSWRAGSFVYSTGLRLSAQGSFQRYHSVWQPDFTNLNENEIWIDLPLFRWTSTLRDQFGLADTILKVSSQSEELNHYMIPSYDVATTLEVAGQPLVVSRINVHESARRGNNQASAREWTFWFSEDARSLVKIERPSWKDPISGTQTGSYTTELVAYELK